MTAAGPTGPGTAEPGGVKPRRRAIVVLALTGALAFLADLSTKHLALATLDDREPVRLLGGAVYLTLTRNSGAAFSLGSDHTWVFSVITFGVIGWIGWMALRLRSVPWGVSLGLVLGGALGNLADRIFRAPGHFVGHVVDMVSLFDAYGRVWPVFNLADSALVSGVTLAIVLELTGRQRDGSRLRSADREPTGDRQPTDAGTGRSDAGPADAGRSDAGRSDAGTGQSDVGTGQADAPAGTEQKERA